MITDKTLNIIKKISIFCGILVIVLILIYSGMISYKTETIDKELSKRLNFCNEKEGYVAYLYDCNMFGECDITYVDCDFVNSWRDYSLMTKNGDWDMSKLKISYSEYMKKKYSPFYRGEYLKANDLNYNESVIK